MRREVELRGADQFHLPQIVDHQQLRVGGTGDQVVAADVHRGDGRCGLELVLHLQLIRVSQDNLNCD